MADENNSSQSALNNADMNATQSVHKRLNLRGKGRPFTEFPHTSFANLEDENLERVCVINVDEPSGLYMTHYVDENDEYAIDVTDNQFKEFLEATGFKPEWPKNFLKHWKNGKYPVGKGDHPVVWVSLKDAKAYAEWAGKRLPTEQEWQKAAQGDDGRDWPWGNIYDPLKANMDSDDTKPVGSYPEGASPYGCLDMTGNVWEWTHSLQADGYHYFCWIRGGSYFFAKGSRWYMQGGPITNYQRAKYWLMTPALNRSSSIGFRCVKDIN